MGPSLKETTCPGSTGLVGAERIERSETITQRPGPEENLLPGTGRQKGGHGPKEGGAGPLTADAFVVEAEAADG